MVRFEGALPVVNFEESDVIAVNMGEKDRYLYNLKIEEVYWRHNEIDLKIISYKPDNEIRMQTKEFFVQPWILIEIPKEQNIRKIDSIYISNIGKIIYKEEELNHREVFINKLHKIKRKTIDNTRIKNNDKSTSLFNKLKMIKPTDKIIDMKDMEELHLDQSVEELLEGKELILDYFVISETDAPSKTCIIL
jgi:hypothetical protein